MQKNVSGQKLIVFAYDATTNLPKSGDAANITAYVSKDYGTVTVLGDTSATEMDATNAKGYYLFDLTQAETNADTLLFSAKSSTSNVVVVGSPATVFTTPPNFSLQSIDSSGRLDVIKVAGTTQTARDLGQGIPNAVPGAAGGLLIAGSNAATTFAGLTTGALSCTTITASGAVAFQSTFTITSTFQAGATTFASLTSTGAFTVNGVSNVAQTGDSFARIGATGSGLSSLAPAATALSTAQWSNTRAGYLDNLGTALTEGYAADGATFTLAQALYMIWSILSERSVSGTTVTAKKLDGSTTSMTFTLDSATQPTIQTRAS